MSSSSNHFHDEIPGGEGDFQNRQGRRLEELLASYQVSHRITSGLDLEQVLQSIVEACRFLTASDGCVMLLLNTEDGGVAEVFSSSDSDIEGKAASPREDSGIIGWVIERKKPALSTNLLEDDRATGVTLEEAMRHPEEKFMVAAPILMENEVIGVLSVTNRAESRPFEPDDLGVVMRFAGQAAIAIYQAHLSREMERARADAESARDVVEQWASELATLNSIGQQVSSSLSMPQVLDVLYEQVSSTMNIDAFFVALVGKDGTTVHCPLFVDNREKCEIPPFPIGDGLVSHVISTGESLLINDLLKEEIPAEPVVVHVDSEKEMLSWLGVPLYSGGKVIGMLCVQSREEAAFDGRTEIFFLTMAAHVAGAVRNAQLYDDLRLAYEELQDTQQRLILAEKQAAVVELAGAVAHELNQPMTVVSAICQMLEKRLETGAEVTEDMDLIVRNVERMAEIVKRIGRITHYKTKEYYKSDNIIDIDGSQPD